MDATRAVAVELVDEGVVDITQRGEKVATLKNEPIRGAIRLRLAEKCATQSRETDVSVGTFEPSVEKDEAVKGDTKDTKDTKAHRRVRKDIPHDAKRRKTRRDDA
jgi:hypothetical protein